MRGSGHFTGSVWLSCRTNRHGYFTNPSDCPRIVGMIPVGCPEKAAFSTVWMAGIFRDLLEYAGTRKNACFSWKFGICHERQTLTYGKRRILDHTLIRRCPEGHGEPKETEPESGSVCLSQRPDRHGFPDNRHGYFTNPSICFRIGGMMPSPCPEKAAFGTVWRADNFRHLLEYAGTRKNACFSWKSGGRQFRRPLPLRKNACFPRNPGSVIINRPSLMEKMGVFTGSRQRGSGESTGRQPKGERMMNA